MTATASSALAAVLERIEHHAPYLRRLHQRQPDVCDFVAAGDWHDFVALREIGGLSAAEVGRALRIAKQRLALGVALGDLAGLLSLEQVVAMLSDFADLALDHAIRAALNERYPDAPPIGFAALALGKHGSRELNYSSDIDPILIFDPATMPRHAREEPIEAAARIARRVSELMQARDEHGYVFRVDLRLRPSPEATPPALPFEAALSYYETSALPWERAAYIRARACAGDVALGQRFLAAIRPFVWRRSLDYGAIHEIRSISRRIRDHHAQGQLFGPGYDLKRGRGGIREVEFFAQVHQLIHGGREPSLRVPATLDALAALEAAGRIEPGTAPMLGEAYRIYRTIEHRLQMVEDQQTHSLPRDPVALDSVARLHGLNDGAGLLALLAPHVARVGACYDGLDGEDEGSVSADPERLEAALSAAGFADPAAARQRIDGWREGKARAIRTQAARDALEAMLPGLLRQFGAAPDPNMALARFDDLVTRLPSAINLFRLIEARPGLGRLLGDVLSHAPALAEALARRADLLDGLIDASALDPVPEVSALAVAFAAGEADDDYQLLLDRVRRRVGERRFALGAQIVEGASDPIEVAAGYARVAEAALRVLADATIAAFEAVHGKVPGGELLILALGRFGGGELTHASDLDLVYLFTGDFDAESDGAKPIGATIYFNRLAQRVSAAMSVPTAAGPLYEVDTRLRPSGTQGPLVVSVESFARYQRESAWLWEHMALCRARPVYGSADARTTLSGIVAATLDVARDPDELRDAAVKMRSDIAKHKPPASPFDIKLAEGGLVDLEFAVHLAQLRHRAGFVPDLAAAIATLIESGLLDPGLAEAHRLLTRMLVTQRLVSPASTEPPPASRALVAQACGLPDWHSLVVALEQARGLVSREWKRIAEIG